MQTINQITNQKNRSNAMTNLKSFSELSNQELMTEAPAIFADHASMRVSDRYSFIPTMDIVNEMRIHGWAPVNVQEQRVKLNSDRYGFQKHMIRFQRKSDIELARKVNDLIPEVILTNSHDAKSAFILHAGLYRLACSNGLMIADGTFQSIHVMHTGQTKEIVDASFEILESIPGILDEVKEFKARQLESHEALAYSTAALTFKYGSIEDSPITPHDALKIRRSDDKDLNLWNTYNVVQENLIKGGQRGRYRMTTEVLPGKKFSRTREVKSIDENVRLNKALWTLAEALKDRKSINLN